jgi:hypothetical protein
MPQAQLFKEKKMALKKSIDTIYVLPGHEQCHQAQQRRDGLQQLTT